MPRPLSDLANERIYNVTTDGIDYRGAPIDTPRTYKDEKLRAQILQIEYIEIMIKEILRLEIHFTLLGKFEINVVCLSFKKNHMIADYLVRKNLL